MTQIPPNIGIIGLGYVGLPLAVAFSKQYKVVGFDINKQRIDAINKGEDLTLEVDSKTLLDALSDKPTTGLRVTNQASSMADVNFYIVTVPTPIDEHKQPVLTPLIMASRTVGKLLKPNDIVVYESTVYPGATEEVCVPILEKESGLTFNKDFYVGYSPERINPGDKKHTVTNILKVTSGSTQEAAKHIDQVYASVILAGTHRAPSIKVAEAAKVIENSQRDINIAFVNELSKIFRILDIDTAAVLEAAATKWNFIRFTPGLVGGHCIGVDPYYLAQKAITEGYDPEIILAGRRMNDGMGAYVAQEVVRIMIAKEAKIKDANALILGVTFKENCPDIRNTRVIDVIQELEKYHINVDIYDPWVSKQEVHQEFNRDVFTDLKSINKKYDTVILAVAHSAFKDLDIAGLTTDQGIVYDVKSFLPHNQVDGRL